MAFFTIKVSIVNNPHYKIFVPVVGNTQSDICCLESPKRAKNMGGKILVVAFISYLIHICVPYSILKFDQSSEIRKTSLVMLLGEQISYEKNDHPCIYVMYSCSKPNIFLINLKSRPSGSKSRNDSFMRKLNNISSFFFIKNFRLFITSTYFTIKICSVHLAGICIYFSVS